MAYPEPILPLSGKKAESFRKRFDEFKVSDGERERLKGITGRVRNKMAE